MSRQEQQKKMQPAAQDSQSTPPLQQTSTATGHLDSMTADLERIKKNDQLFSRAFEGMAKNPVLTDEKQATVLIENIVQETGQ
jgi:hypothetical protein